MERETVYHHPGLRIERGSLGGRPVLFVELGRWGDRRVRLLESRPAGALEILEHRVEDETDHFAIEHLPGGQTVDTLMSRHHDTVGRWAGARCEGCGGAIDARITEFGPQLLCHGCGAMFEPDAIEPPVLEPGARLGTPLPFDVALAIALPAIAAARDGWCVVRHHSWTAALGDLLHIDANGRCRWVGLDLVESLYDPDPERTLPPLGDRMRYMSPEVGRGLPTEPSSMVFSIAALLFELSRGEHPLGSWETDYDFVMALREAEPPPRDDRLGALLARALATAPGRRPSFDALESELRAIAAELGVDHSPDVVARYSRALRPPMSLYDLWPMYFV